MGLFTKKPKAPWEKFYTKEQLKLEIPDISIYEQLKQTANKHSEKIALYYYGTTFTFRELIKEIDNAAKAFSVMGIKEKDVVTVCMPNTPEGIISFYALNKIGAIASMIHPLSGEEEIKEYLNSTNSVMLVLIDLCYEKVKDIIDKTNVKKTIVVSVKDSMPFLLGLGYTFTKGFKVSKPRHDKKYIYWREFIRKKMLYRGTMPKIHKEAAAVILHSGGTTGSPKGILLSNSNFVASAEQIKLTIRGIEPGDKAIGVMPIFHGFGLAVNYHAVLFMGAGVVTLPQFDTKKFDELLDKYKPEVLLGVPTLYEALTNIKNTEDMDLSYLKYMISGGDSLSAALELRINKFLEDRNSKIKVTQGYGMTESVAATAVAFGDAAKPGSIGVPFPGNYYKIIDPLTREEVPYGTDGEICVSGPTVMMGYLNNEKETNDMLQIHKDKMVWLHTGDMGIMDEDGVIFYRQRIKRMIITSGYNVYPQYIEDVIEQHEDVLKCTVVGIPHPYKVEVAKAFIVLKNDRNNLFIKKSIKDHCEKNLAKYAIPYEFEFRDSLPKTLIGKVDFKKLQEESINEAKKEEK